MHRLARWRGRQWRSIGFTSEQRPVAESEGENGKETKSPCCERTVGAGFPPETMHTKVKFCASQRLKAAGVSAAMTEIEDGGAAE